MITNKWARIGVYVGIIGAGATAIGFGVADASTTNQVLMFILGPLGITAGGTALTNLTPTPGSEKVPVDRVADMIGLVLRRLPEQAVTEVVDGRSVAVAKSVDQARRDIEAQLGRHRES